MNNLIQRPDSTARARHQITGLLVHFPVKDIRPLAAEHGEGFRETPTLMAHVFLYANQGRTAKTVNVCLDSQ